MFSQIGLGILTPLPDPFVPVRIPATGFVDDPGFYPHVNQLSHFGDTFTIHNIEINLLERCSDLVLHNFDPCLVPHDLLTVFKRADTADIETNRRIKL